MKNDFNHCVLNWLEEGIEGTAIGDYEGLKQSTESGT